MDIIRGERRSARRYEMELSVRYRVALGRDSLRVGYGKTADLSSGGVSFVCQENLPVGRHIELFVDWPILTYAVEPVELVVSGRVVRSYGGITAVHLRCYEFRHRDVLTGAHFEIAERRPYVA